MSDSLFERGSSQAKKTNAVPVGAMIFADMPYTLSALSDSLDGDGKVLKGCTLRLSLYAGEIQVCVTDEPNHLFAYLNLDPFKSLSEALEEVLSAGSINWQKSRGKR